ncbi:hypothetical protein H0H93_006367, partial [Arthromyces matolae]
MQPNAFDLIQRHELSSYGLIRIPLHPLCAVATVICGHNLLAYIQVQEARRQYIEGDDGGSKQNIRTVGPMIWDAVMLGIAANPNL